VFDLLSRPPGPAIRPVVRDLQVIRQAAGGQPAGPLGAYGNAVWITIIRQIRRLGDARLPGR